MQFEDNKQFYDYMTTVCPHLDSFKQFSDLIYEEVVQPLQQHNEELVQRAAKVAIELLSLKKQEQSTYKEDIVPADSLLYALNRNDEHELVGIYQEKQKRKIFYRIIWRMKHNGNS